MSENQRIHLKRPDDWHLHLRDGEMLRAVLPATAAHFARAIVMPNLVPPVVRTVDAEVYQEQIRTALPTADFLPLMTLYLTENTDPEDVLEGYRRGIVKALKLYPAGATTNSDAGVRRMEAVYPVLEVMAEAGIPLLVHGEVVDSEIDIFDREAVFIERVLAPLLDRFPGLKVVLEHVTTSEGVDFVATAGQTIAATVTPHHLIINRNAMLVGGIRPHNYCLPVPKRERHRARLVDAVTSGHARFFLGTDSAPHLERDKETDCGCAGIYNVPVALACLAHVFEAVGALDRLEAFTSLNGPAFYGLPTNSEEIVLERSELPLTYHRRQVVGDEGLRIFDPGFPLHWQVL